jgi:hypothetical protein
LDIAGREIKRMVVAPNQIIEFGAELKAGAYLVEVLQGEQSVTKRIIKF